MPSLTEVQNAESAKSATVQGAVAPQGQGAADAGTVDPQSGLPTTYGRFNWGELPDLAIVIDGIELDAVAKEFSTGSLGWYANGKLTITLPNGQKVKAQLGMNLTVVDSKKMEGAEQTIEAAKAAKAVKEAKELDKLLAQQKKTAEKLAKLGK